MNPVESDTLNKHLQRILSLHFDNETGSPYWLEKQSELNLNVIHEIQSVEDLYKIGQMDENALADRPIEDFIPKSQLTMRHEFIIAETGGTMGKPKYAVHQRDEFHRAFIEPFIKACQYCQFPQGLNWLYVGPSGPHVIGKAARVCAQALHSPDPFAVDFDPRWAKKMVEGSFAAKRYLQHIEEQALRILNTQMIGVIFSTPVVLLSLAENLSTAQRERIKGLHLGGMAVTNTIRDRLSDVFPNAVLLSGFGNTLLGMSPELNYSTDTGIHYYPLGDRLIFNIVEESDQNATFKPKIVEYNQRGRILVHRLDEAQLILNLLERDTAIRITPITDYAKDGFTGDGLCNPQPMRTEQIKPMIGLY